ncbi:macrolide 2'-phosphotransferase [uncultured Corynebacterium sp.]|uniref:macrolide 2'-phosphotransferase n=1 Tax=uncultured Corynebacterium sp. TaxID=159447 RepID=UPI0025F6345B|nr:macrolide 2'-phosphotransferase [uncultured Corynebacterium sp.]
MVEIMELARAHDLDLDPASLNIIEMGLDFRVVLATAVDGHEWVLRIPRHPTVMQRAASEAAVLKVVARHLSVEVPNWQIHTPELIAYPLLPGTPGLELNDQGEPIWNVNVSAPAYVDSLARVIAEIHAIPVTAVPLPQPSLEQVRENWRTDIDRVTAHFPVDNALLTRWQTWIDDASYWPGHTVLTHGEIYAGHTLVDNSQITGVIDWTTASINDPARDLMMQQMSGTPESFERFLRQYVEHGGQIWPRIREHCRELSSTAPLGFALYALEVDNLELRETATQLLNPTT